MKPSIETWHDGRERLNYRALLIAILLTMFSLSLVSCTSSGMSSDYASGDQGIEIEVVHTSGSKLIHGEFLNLFLEVFNKGTYDNPQGTIYITGYDPNAIFFKETSIAIPPISGKSQFLPEGDSELLKIEETQPMSVNFGASYKGSLQFTACYKYQTRAVVSACIVPNMKEYTQQESVCKPSPQSLSSQGAPVAVTYIEPSMSSDKMQYLIHVENIGEGKVLKEESLSMCPFNVGMNDLDEVSIEVSLSAIGQAECKNNNRIKLIDGKGVAMCVIQKDKGDYSYKTEMEITLDYGYSQTSSQEFEIINPFYEGKEDYLNTVVG